MCWVRHACWLHAQLLLPILLDSHGLYYKDGTPVATCIDIAKLFDGPGSSIQLCVYILTWQKVMILTAQLPRVLAE